MRGGDALWSRTRLICSVAAVMLGTVAAAAETLTCTDWQGFRTCQDGHGYVSHEHTWQGRTYGDDNAGNKWSAHRWQDQTIIEDNR